MTPTSRKGPLTMNEKIPWAANQSKTNPQQSRKRTMPLQLMSPDVQLNKLNSMRVESEAFANEEPSLLSMNFESIERTLDKRRESESFVDFY